MTRPGADGITSATLHILASRGVEETTLRNIAAEAGITEPAIYRHFASRSDLLRSVFLHCAEALYAALDEARLAAGSPLAEIPALAGAFFDFAFEHADQYAFILAVHQRQLRDLDTANLRLPKDLFVDAVRRVQKLGGGAGVPASLVAGVLIGVVHGAILFATTGRTRASRKVCREYVTRVVAEIAHASCKRPTNQK
jgi:AcrR family transcriptional regulator